MRGESPLSFQSRVLTMKKIKFLCSIPTSSTSKGNIMSVLWLVIFQSQWSGAAQQSQASSQSVCFQKSFLLQSQEDPRGSFDFSLAAEKSECMWSEESGVQTQQFFMNCTSVFALHCSTQCKNIEKSTAGLVTNCLTNHYSTCWVNFVKYLQR